MICVSELTSICTSLYTLSHSEWESFFSKKENILQVYALLMPYKRTTETAPLNNERGHYVSDIEDFRKYYQQALKFKSMFAVVVHTELILVLSHLINTALLLCFKDIGDVQNPIDLQMIPGLHLLFGDHPLGVLKLTLLSQVTPFAIWYLIVLSLGVAIVADLKRRRVEWLVVLVWLVDIGFRIATSVL